MNNSTLIYNARHKQILQIQSIRNNTQPKQTPRMNLRLPNCSPQSKYTDFKVKKQNSFILHKKTRSYLQSPDTQQKLPNRDSSESFMKDLELSGNEELIDINKSLLLTSQEINRKMQFKIESYLNDAHKLKQLNKKINYFVDHTQTKDSSFSCNQSRNMRRIPQQSIKLYRKK